MLLLKKLKNLEKSLKYVPRYQLTARYEKEKKNKIKEMAIAMKLKGIDTDTIVSITGLSKAVVNGLKID